MRCNSPMTVVFGQRANVYIHLDNCLCSRKDNADMPVSISNSLRVRRHDWTSLGFLLAFCGFSVSNICASIIMMQKVAANVDNVAADLCFRASKVRWLLMKIFFALAASSAADFVCFYLL